MQIGVICGFHSGELISDIFISYAREDRDKTKAIAAVFEEQGLVGLVGPEHSAGTILRPADRGHLGSAWSFGGQSLGQSQVLSMVSSLLVDISVCSNTWL